MEDSILLRRYNGQRDKEAVLRTWREVGWVDKDRLAPVEALLETSSSWVAEVNGQAETHVTTVPGSVRYLGEELPFSCVASVMTSRIARKQGLASRLTAKAVAAEAAEGAMVAGLGMFEQGFYNQIGFGTGCEEVWITFDPAQLRVDAPARSPRRITPDDWNAVHQSRLSRKPCHGMCNLTPPGVTRSEMLCPKDGFGLGYYDGPGGELTHHLWCQPPERADPFTVNWMAWRTGEQFLELMGVIKSLGDQVRAVEMRQPPGMQMQDLLSQPFRFRQLTAKSKYEAKASASAYWQMRICDLSGCLAATHLSAGPVRFNLALTDPIERLLEPDISWRGISGEYAVCLGGESACSLGRDRSLPTVTASVGAFTRLWMGVLPASALAVTDDLSGPPELLGMLDSLLVIPRPHPDWDF